MGIGRGRAIEKAMVVVGGAVAILAGCATGVGDEVARRAQTAMVGMPKTELLACAGVPDRQAMVDGKEYFTYVRPPLGAYNPTSSIGIGAGSFGGGSGIGLGLGFGVPIGGTSPPCEATMVLGRNGTVEQVSYPAGMSPGSCAPIVRNCVPSP